VGRPSARARFGIALAWAALSPLAISKTTTYVCTGPDGSRTIQDVPCKPLPTVPVVAARPCPMTDAEFEGAVRQETAFLARFGSAASHRSAHRAELAPVVAGLKPMLERLGLLLRDRRAIAKEMEFFVGKPLPSELAARNDANQAQLAGLTLAFQQREETIRQIEARGRCQIETFGPLWTGADSGISACKRPPCTAP